MKIVLIVKFELDLLNCWLNLEDFCLNIIYCFIFCLIYIVSGLREWINVL